MNSKSSLKIQINNFQDCYRIVRKLKEEVNIAISFAKLTESDFHKSIFFLAGASFSLGGEMEKIDEKKFLFYFNDSN